MTVSTLPVKRASAILFLLAFLARQGHADTLLITNSADSGEGSLRSAVSRSHSTAGSDTLLWAAEAGGTLSLSGDLGTIADGSTLDVSSAATAVTIAGSPNSLTLGGDVSFKNSSLANAWSISAVIDGAGSLAKTGAGTLNLSGVNTYTGGTSLSAGTLSVNGDSALGNAAGGLLLNGGTLRTSAAVTSARALTLGSQGGTIDAAQAGSTFSGVIGAAGSLGITDSIGGGTITLAGANTFSGGLTVNGALGVSLQAAAANVFGSGAVVLNSGLGRADLNLAGFNQTIGSLTADANSTVRLAAAQLTSGADNTSSTFAGTISDGGAGGSLVKTGGGVWNLTRANSYSGGTTVNAGTLGIDDLSALGSGAVTLDGGTLRTNSALTFSRDMTLGASGGTIDTAGNDSSFSGILSAGALTKAGNGTLTLSGVNTYAGGTTLSAGTLSVAAENNLGAPAGALTFAGGTLKTLGGLVDARAVTLSGGGTIDVNGLTSTFSGVFADGSSAGRLRLTDSAGAGKLTLSNVNTYSGGTVLDSGILSVSNDNNLGAASGGLVFNGGTLQTTTGISSSRTVVLNGSGAVIDTQNLNSSFSGGISGGGALTTLGNGTVSLTGANTYGGGSVLNTGKLNINNDFALGTGALTFNAAGSLETNAANILLANNISLAANGSFNILGNTTTLSGVVSGAGSLNLVSSGTLFLTGNNTFTGGTLVGANGVLRINKSAGLGTGSLTLNNATLQTNAALTLTNPVSLGAGGGVIDTLSADSTVSGTISGAGPLTKTGSGVLTLASVNSYTGGTIVNQGTLALGVDNALAAAGALTVNSGGTFSLIDRVQTVASLGGAGGLQMTIRPAVTSLAVTGNAALAGSLRVNLTPRIVLEGDLLTPITYGSRTGTFSNIVSPAAVAFDPIYNANSVTLRARLVPLAESVVTPNQGSVAGALEPLRSAPTGDVAAVLGNLYTLDAPQLRAALDQISPISLASIRGLDMAAAGAQASVVGQRMIAIADGSSRRARMTHYTVNKPAPYPGILLAYAGNDLSSLDLRAADERGTSPWGFFASAVGGTGRLTEANGASGSQPGYSFTTGGLTAGADYRTGDHTAVGAAIGYLRGHASIYAPAAGTVDGNSARLGVFGTAFSERARASLYLGGAADFYKTRRDITFSGISRTATAAPRGRELNANVGASFDLKTHFWGTYSPFAGLAYDRLMIDRFTETGADSLDLAVGAQTAQSLQSSLGLRYSDTFTGEVFTWKPYVSAGWRHQFDNQRRPIDARLVNAGGQTLSVTTGDFARDGTLLGTGFLLILNPQASVRLDYSGDFRSHFQENTVNALMRYRF
ncbi:MAG: autotransporter domain-containing protein [Elusimicrobiota bacterium]